MQVKRIFVALGIMMCTQIGWAASYQVKVDTGVVLLWQAKTNYWAAVKDSANVAYSDSLYVDDKYSAALSMGKGAVILIKGESRLCLKGSDSGAELYFDVGQIFLKRDATNDGTPIKILMKGCAVTPVGTAAAIKLTKAGEPSVAVLNGKMRMESVKGESITVEPGKFGTYNPEAGMFKQGSIPPEAVAALENWSGVKQELPVPVAKISDSVNNAQKPDSAKAANPAQTPAVATTPVSPLTSVAPIAENKTESKSGDSPESRQAKRGGAQRISWEISAASVTVDGTQWTRLAISPDIPIWKFGLGLDFELFLDQNGNFSKKSWEFGNSDDVYNSISRKIKYLRFGQEADPLFVKVGGLSSVTLGYGFLVENFTNLLRYPDQKLLGVQVYLNNVSPLGITLQTMTPDVMEFRTKGGIAAARLALMPLQATGIPFIKNLSIGGTYATDLNQFAPARDWSSGNISDKNHNGITDWDYAYQHNHTAADSASVRTQIKNGVIDSLSTTYAKPDSMYRDTIRRYALLGADIGFPLIKTALLGIDVYGQAGVVADSNLVHHPTGWGFGAPGVRLNVGPLLAQVEYRHIHGEFLPGYFGEYYLDERVQRKPVPAAKSDSLKNNDLDGIYGKLGLNLFNLLMVTGSYQYMVGTGDAMDQRFEATGGIGDAVIKRIPKVTKAEFYFYKTNINRTIVVFNSKGINKGKPYIVNGKPIYDDFLEMTPSLYWGYRVGFEITKGASIIWDTRYGYQWDDSNKLIANNQMIIQTAVNF